MGLEEGEEGGREASEALEARACEGDEGEGGCVRRVTCWVNSVKSLPAMGMLLMEEPMT